MLPAHQRFRAAQNRLRGLHPVFRLIVYDKLLLRQRVLEIIHQPPRVHFLPAQIIIINGHGFGIAVPDAVRRTFGPVKAALRIAGLVRAGADADPDPHAPRRLLTGGRRHPLRKGSIVRHMRAVDLEGIGFPAAGDAALFMDDGIELRADPAQDFIPVRFPEAFIDDMEAADIQHHRIRPLVRVPRVILIHIAVKVFPVIQARQMIPLRPPDQVPVLRELDAAADPGQHNLLARIGLGNKVARPGQEAVHLRLGIRGQHDHGNPGKIHILLDLPQQIQPLHPGQIQIQQHQAEGFAVLHDHFQSYIPGLGAQNLVFCLQIRLQDFPVHKVILDNQHKPLPAFFPGTGNPLHHRRFSHRRIAPFLSGSEQILRV